MTHDLQSSIESYLLNEPGNDGWFLTKHIVARFNLADDRSLRATGRHPGQISRCTIFSGRGIKHVSRASFAERLAFKHRLKRELVSRARRLRWYNETVAACLDGRFEKHTGQGVLF